MFFRGTTSTFFVDLCGAIYWAMKSFTKRPIAVVKTRALPLLILRKFKKTLTWELEMTNWVKLMASTFCIYDSSLFFAGVWIRNHVFLSKCLEQQFFFLKRFEANQNLAKSPNASTITLRLRPNRRTSHNWKPELCCSSCYLSMSAFDERSPAASTAASSTDLDMESFL